MTGPCMCTQVFDTPCLSEAEADCRFVYRNTVLRCTSECLYALLDTDEVTRDIQQRQRRLL